MLQDNFGNFVKRSHVLNVDVHRPGDRLVWDLEALIVILRHSTTLHSINYVLRCLNMIGFCDMYTAYGIRHTEKEEDNTD